MALLAFLIPVDGIFGVGTLKICKAGEGLWKIPRVKNLDAEAREVLHISGNQCEAVFDGGCRDHAISYAKRATVRLSVGVKDAPAFGDSLRDGEDAFPK